MKDLETIFLKSLITEKDKIIYIDLNISENISLKIISSNSEDENRIELKSTNGLFKNKTYFLRDKDLNTDTSAIFCYKKL